RPHPCRLPPALRRQHEARQEAGCRAEARPVDQADRPHRLDRQPDRADAAVEVRDPGGDAQARQHRPRGRVALQIRPARSSESAALRDLVQRAYGHYVERIGMRPGPMDADYDAAVRDARAWVADEGGAIAGLLVLEIHDDHLLIENVA